MNVFLIYKYSKSQEVFFYQSKKHKNAEVAGPLKDLVFMAHTPEYVYGRFFSYNQSLLRSRNVNFKPITYPFCLRTMIFEINPFRYVPVTKFLKSTRTRADIR